MAASTTPSRSPWCESDLESDRSPGLSLTSLSSLSPAEIQISPTEMQSRTTRGAPDGIVLPALVLYTLILSTVALRPAGLPAGLSASLSGGLAARAGLDTGTFGGFAVAGDGGRVPSGASLAKSLLRTAADDDDSSSSSSWSGG